MKRLGHLLAALAMALHAFWPLIAQAKPKSVELVPVCTVGGVTHYAEIPLGNSPLEQKSASHHDHCAFCSFGGERAILSAGFSNDIAVQPISFASCRREISFLEGQSPFFARPRAPPELA